MVFKISYFIAYKYSFIFIYDACSFFFFKKSSFSIKEMLQLFYYL